MAIKEGLIEVYQKVCRWCKYFRGVEDPLLCDSEEPCLVREDLEEMRKAVDDREVAGGNR